MNTPDGVRSERTHPPILRFYDVHVWPEKGRILLINAGDHNAIGTPPILTWLDVHGNGYVDPSCVTVLADILANAGDSMSRARVISHDTGGMSTWTTEKPFQVTRMRSHNDRDPRTPDGT